MSPTFDSIRRSMTRHDLLAAGLLVTGLAVFLLQVAPLGRENALLEQQIAVLRAETSASQAARPGVVDESHRVRMLPNRQQRDADIARIPLLVRTHGLQLRHMGFEDNLRPSADALATSLNGQIAVDGSYLSIREWLNEVLRKMPSLEVSTLRLHRSAATGDVLQARLEVIYFFSASSPDAAAGAQPPIAPRTLPPDAAPVFDPFGPTATAVRAVMPGRAADPGPTPTPTPDPALPVTHGGSYRANGIEVHLLIEGDNVHRLRVGEALPGGEFRLESANRQQLELLHLPSGRRYPLLTGNLTP